MGMDEAAGRMISAMAQVSQQNQSPQTLYVGTVLVGTEDGLKIRCNGLEIEREDLWISPRLLTGYCPKLKGTHPGSGTCSSHGGAVTVTVPVSPTELTRAEFELKTGDTVLVFSPDQQEYFILDKAVKL